MADLIRSSQWWNIVKDDFGGDILLSDDDMEYVIELWKEFVTREDFERQAEADTKKYKSLMEAVSNG